MNCSLLANVLRCPYCGGAFHGSGTEVSSNTIDYGILTCDCSRFPVVAGIPVLMRDKKTLAAVTTIEHGHHIEALLTLIQPSLPMSPMWRLSSSIPFGGQLKGLVQQHRLHTWRNQITSLLGMMERGDEITVCEVLNAYFPNKNHYNYFAYRFSQPRYLVALSLATLIQQPQKPILDFCCGEGHLTRSLVQHSNHQQVIGVDRSLWGLYVAKRWIAPEGEYVCCSAENALPFAEKIFSFVYCSDAFHYVVNKYACVHELRRITDEGTMVLTWTHNKRVRMQNDGVPLSPEGYHALFRELPHRIVADEDILNCYLRKEGPSLATQPETKYLNGKPLLSIVVSHRQDLFSDGERFGDWPHAKGRLGLNPLYTVELNEGASKKIPLHRRFPSRFFEEDHSECKTFLPETVEIDSQTLRDLVEGKRTPAVETLIDHMIVLGLPENYRSAPHLTSSAPSSVDSFDTHGAGDPHLLTHRTT
jgi:SAM-dependent methyltransferase/uncharacterized protein YbaR (Trm112 family)